MRRESKLAGAVIIAATLALSGQVPVEPVPLPLIEARAIPPGVPITPLTPKEKAALTLRNTFGINAIFNRALFSMYDQLVDSPEEWPGTAEGYGMRLGASMGRLASRNALLLGGNVAFKLDPRYDRCSCSGFLPRTRHAVKRVLVARRDNGGQMVNIPRLTAAYVSPIISNQWMPDRYNNWTNHYQMGTGHLGWTAAGNMLREFWPDISRKMPFRRK
ncbi:MAG: hypothetical protein WKF37_00780 [Bryobacteraceae bacterium]